MFLIFIVVVKFINSERDTVTLKEIYTETLANFPIGQSFIATVPYPSTAYFLSKSAKTLEQKRFFFTSAAVIVLIVRVLKLTGSGNTVTEVIAGWSL